MLKIEPKDRPVVYALLAVALAFLITAATSNDASQKQQGASVAGQSQNGPSPEASLNQIKTPEANNGGSDQEQQQGKRDTAWGDWLADNNHWIVLGTLLLAAAAIAQVEVSRRTAKRQLRAYVLIESVSVYDGSRVGLATAQKDFSLLLPEYQNCAVVDLVIKNSGQTPAGHVTHWAAMAVADGYTEQLLVPPAILGETQASVVGPGTTITKSVVLQPFPLAEPVLSELKAHRKGIYVYGKIVYRDIFKRTRTTTYRLRYTGVWPPIPSGNLTFCLAGNSFD